MKLIRIFCFLCSIALFTSCSIEDLVTGTLNKIYYGNVEFSGVVKDNATQKPLKGVLVETIPESQSAITDSAGRYFLKADKLVKYKLCFSKLGYFNASIELDSKINNILKFDCDLGKIAGEDLEKERYFICQVMKSDTFQFTQFRVSILKFLKDTADEIYLIDGYDYPPTNLRFFTNISPGKIESNFWSEPALDHYLYLKYVYPSGMVEYTTIERNHKRDVNLMLSFFPKGWKLYIPFNYYDNEYHYSIPKNYISYDKTIFGIDNSQTNTPNYITLDRGWSTGSLLLNANLNASFTLKNSEMRLNNEMTVCFWYKPWSNSFINKGLNSLVSMSKTGGDPDLIFGFNRDSNSFYTGYKESKLSINFHKINKKVDDINWAFIAVSISGQDLKIYFDNNLIYSGKLNGDFKLSELNMYCGYVKGDRSFNASCQLDDFTLFGRALTLEEIIQMSKYYFY